MVTDVVEVSGFKKLHDSVPDGSLGVSDGKNTMASVGSVL
jgi:hypothetical protein